jgi:hypothetical protein
LFLPSAEKNIALVDTKEIEQEIRNAVRDLQIQLFGGGFPDFQIVSASGLQPAVPHDLLYAVDGATVEAQDRGAGVPQDMRGDVLLESCSFSNPVTPSLGDPHL